MHTDTEVLEGLKLAALALGLAALIAGGSVLSSLI